MADAHGHGEHQDHFRLYMIIAACLAVATAMSFVVNGAVRGGTLTPEAGASIIMLVAVGKACLVGWIFMHLKWDWTRLYFMVFPLFILAVMMVVVLLPDIVFAWLPAQPSDYNP